MYGICASVVLAAAGALAVDGNHAVIRFKTPPLEVSERPTLGEIADVIGPVALADPLKAIELGQSPMAGHRATVSSRELLEWVRTTRPDLADSVVWEGVPSAIILRPGMELPLKQLNGQAESTLNSWLRERYKTFEVDPVAASAGVLKMSRKASIDMAVQGASASRRMAVLAIIHEPGLPDRALPLWFNVSAFAEAWVATKDIPAGAQIDDAVFKLQMMDVAGVPGAVPADFSSFSAKQAVTPIEAGRVLTSRLLVDRPLVVAGDRVQLRATVGAVSIESVGIAQQSGGKGQRVLVENAGSGVPLSARVIAAGIVEAMP